MSHAQQSYLCPKNQNYLLGKADLRFFLSHRLRVIIFLTVITETRKKMKTISIKLFKVNMELYGGKGKNKSFCEIASRKV